MRATEGALCVTKEDHRDLLRWHSEQIVGGVGPSNSAVRMRAELQLQWLAGHLPGTEIAAHVRLGILPVLAAGDTTTVPPVPLHAHP